MEKKLSLTEARKTMTYLIANNKKLQEVGDMPIAFELESPPGIGKTTLIQDLAKDLNMDIVVLNLSQIDELGDLVGLPLKEYEFCNQDGECIWVPEKTVGYYQNVPGWTFNNNTRTHYSKPFWLKEHYANGLILCLDDHSRAKPTFQQATMELIDYQCVRYLN